MSFNRSCSWGRGWAGSQAFAAVPAADAPPDCADRGLRAGAGTWGGRSWMAVACVCVALLSGRAYACAAGAMSGDPGSDGSAAMDDPIAMIAEVVDPVSCAIVPGPTVSLPFGHCVELFLAVTFPGIGTFDVTDSPLTTFRFSTSGDDPDGCVFHARQNRFCLRPDAPASCIGKHINVSAAFNFGVDSCTATTTIIPSGVDCTGSLLFSLSLGYRLFPADCTLRQETITPIVLDPTLTGATVQLVDVSVNAAPNTANGIDPAFVIVKDTATPASPNMIVQLRACLNTGAKRRIYTLTFKVTRPDGLVVLCTIQVDVPVCCKPRGVLF